MKAITALVLVASLFGGAAMASSAVAQMLASADREALTDMTDVMRIKSGEVNCAHCDLRGADLSHECVKGGDLTGANFDGVTARYMCMSIANFTNATFRNADLSGANLGHSNLTRADLTGAKLAITSIKGANLATAKGLTQSQIDRSCGDAETKLPAGLKVHFCQ